MYPILTSPQRALGVTDLFCQFLSASERREGVTVTSLAGDFTGRLSHSEAGGLRIACAAAPTGIAPGQSLCLEYDDAGDTLRLYAEVVYAAPDHVLTSFPYAAEAPARRRSARVAVPKEANLTFSTAAGERLVVVDLSLGGVCFVDTRDRGLRIGEAIPGALELPGGEAVSWVVAVRHFGLRHGRLHVGAEVVEIALRGRLRVARAIARLEQGASPTLPNQKR